MAGFAEAAARPGWVLTFTSNEIARFVRAGGAGVEHWLTLDVSVRSYGLRLNPVLSVRHVEVAELAGHLLGRSGEVAQVGKALADLVRADGRPSAAEWLVESDDDLEPMTGLVLAEVAALGPAFHDRLSTLADVIRELESTPLTNIHLAYLAVAHALGGGPARVPEVLAEIERWVATAPAGAEHQMAGFLEAFRARFGTATGPH